MKRVYNLIWIALAVIATVACSRDEEALFDQSTSQRADAAVKESWDVLVGAENGWIMQYFPATGQAYGGYNFYLDFSENGEVEAGTEIMADPSLTSKSLFSISHSAGTVLSFDMLNDIFHIFADPSAPAGGATGIGIEGENDFLVISATPEQVLLKGRKTGNYMSLIPMEGTWLDYLAACAKREPAMEIGTYNFEADGKTISAKIKSRQLTYDNVLEDGSVETVYMAYVPTPNGVKLYQPLKIGDVSISGIYYDEAKDLFYAEGENTVDITKIYPTPAEYAIQMDWYTTYAEGGPHFKQFGDYTGSPTQLERWGSAVQYVALAPNALYLDNQFSVRVTLGLTREGGSSLFTGDGNFYVEYLEVGENTLTVSVMSYVDQKASFWTMFVATFRETVQAFGDPWASYPDPSPARTFDVTVDDPKNPTVLKLVQQDDPENTMTFHSTPVEFWSKQ